MSKSSSSQEVVESLLSGKLRTLMGDVNCFGEVRVEEADDDGTSLLAIGMKLLLLLDVDDGEDTRIFRGGGLQSLSHELLLLFFLLFWISNLTPALINCERVCAGERNCEEEKIVKLFPLTFFLWIKIILFLHLIYSYVRRRVCEHMQNPHTLELTSRFFVVSLTCRGNWWSKRGVDILKLLGKNIILFCLNLIFLSIKKIKNESHKVQCQVWHFQEIILFFQKFIYSWPAFAP